MNKIDSFLSQEKIGNNDYCVKLKFYQFFPKSQIIERKFKLSNMNFIEQKGFNVRFELYNYTKFMKCLFPKCEIKDHQYNNEVGHPDFIVEKDNDKIYIEFKLEGEALRHTQINWIFNNKDKDVYILYINKIAGHKERTKKVEEISEKKEIIEDEEEIDYAEYAKTLTY